MIRCPEPLLHGDTDPRWPNLKFTEFGAERLKEVDAFLERLPETHPARVQFKERMDYLNEYGGCVQGPCPTCGQPHEFKDRRRFKIHLGKDWAPYSFSLVWSRRNEDGTFGYGWNGGLIWHGGENDPLTVNVSGDLWGIHT